MTCPKCNSENLKKNGKRSGYQCYLCKDCKHQYVPDKPPAVHVPTENHARDRYIKKTYKEVYLKIRKDTFVNLVDRMDDYAQANPEKGALLKKIYEVLDEHFPKQDS